MDLETEVSRALDALASSVAVEGPFATGTHIGYKVSGLADIEDQRTNLCWVLLGFLGGIYEADFSIDSAIGSGTEASGNLISALEKRLDIGKSLSREQKERKRDPLLQELISHTLVHIHKRQVDDGRPAPILCEWLGNAVACARPHLSANESGIDLIAIGAESNALHPVIGEVKAHEKDPKGAFAEACDKFTEVRRGDYNDEIRAALKDIGGTGGFAREELARNIWVNIGRFGALIGHDSGFTCELDEASRAQSVTSQPASQLFFISTPFVSMRAFFDCLTDRLITLARSLGR